MIKNLLIVLLILLLLHGCASSGGNSSEGAADNSQTKSQRKLQQEKTTAAEDLYTDSNEQAKIITTAAYDNAPKPIKKTRSASREAVLDLLLQAEEAIAVNDYDEAETILKRALRIEPGNAWLWHNLAVVSFYQENYQQAIQQALKSNNLEHHARQLQNNNYKIIEQSYIQLGETSRAKNIRKKYTN